MEQVSVNGDTVTIAVEAVNIDEPVGGLSIDVTYEPSKLSFVSASNGTMLSGSDLIFIASPTTDNSGNPVISTAVNNSSSSAYNGTLFTIKFKGTATGSCDISLESQSSTLFNASHASISGVTWYGGTVVVQ